MPIIQTNKQLRPREKNDFYPTPKELIYKALNLITIQPKTILDAGAGTGVWGQIAKEKWTNSVITGIELQPEFKKPDEYDFWYNQDFIEKFQTQNKYDLNIGNPPYKFAEEFIRKSYKLLETNGQMLLLLRLAFLESQKRGLGLWMELKPKEVHVCRKRPSFTGDSKTDATAYALYLWEEGWKGETKLYWF